jgi:hypothetical protein
LDDGSPVATCDLSELFTQLDRADAYTLRRVEAVIARRLAVQDQQAPAPQGKGTET